MFARKMAVDRKSADPQTGDMKILDQLTKRGHEQVITFSDAASGLRGFLAIHNMNLGPATGSRQHSSLLLHLRTKPPPKPEEPVV